MKNIISVNLLLIFSLLLFGCDKISSEEKKLIDDVRNKAFNNELTFSQSLENTPYCKNSKWEHKKDQNQRDVIIHSCKITVQTENIEKFIKEIQINKESGIKVSGIKKAKDQVFSMNFNLQKAIEFSEEANEKDKAFKDNKCDEYKASPNYNASPCFIYEDAAKSLRFYENEIKRQWMVTSLSEAKKMVGERENFIEQDLKTLNKLIIQFNNTFFKFIPKELEIHRHIEIIILPNNRVQWTYPSFTNKELELQYNSMSYDQSTKDLGKAKLGQDYNIDVLLLKKIFKIDIENEFKNFLESRCTEDGCPLDSMLR
jgi:hypothetical protein